MLCNTIPAKKHQKGFSLIEAMVALFVLTIGVLGAAGLQAQAMRSGSVAAQRMFVTMKTQELMDRIRANAGNIRLTYSVDPVANKMLANETLVSDVGTLYDAAGPTDGGCNSGNICTSAGMVAHDIFMWQNALNDFLPGNPNYTVSVDADLNVTLSVSWDERGITQNYSLMSQIRPLVLAQ